MVRMLGENILPESVQTARRNLRNRVTRLRQPIRRRREELVPGPDLIGQAESTVMDLRDRFVGRDSLLDRVRSQAMPGTSESEGNGSTDSKTTSSNDNTPTT